MLFPARNKRHGGLSSRLHLVQLWLCSVLQWFIVHHVSFHMFSSNRRKPTSSSCAQSRWCSQGISQPLLWKYSCFWLPWCWRIVALYSSLRWLCAWRFFFILSSNCSGILHSSLAHLCSRRLARRSCWFSRDSLFCHLFFDFAVFVLAVLAQTVQESRVQALLVFAHVVSEEEVAGFREILSVWPFLASSFSLLKCLPFVVTFAVFVLDGSFVVLA